MIAGDRQIRDAGLMAWLLREDGLPDDRHLEALLGDPDEGIRWRVLVTASKDPERGPGLLARIEQEDEDVYFRLVARRRAADLGQPA